MNSSGEPVIKYIIGIAVGLLSLYVSIIAARVDPEGYLSRLMVSATALGMSALFLFWREPFLEVIVRTNRLWGIHHTGKRQMRILVTLMGLATLVLGIVALLGLIPLRPRG